MKDLKKWELLKVEDASPSPHFPLEKRTYRRPDGEIVPDFYVTTLESASHIIPITKDKKIILIRQFKQGINEIVIQFPAGRIESKHKDMESVAVAELEEEAGIKITKDQLIFVSKYAIMTTKSSETAYIYIAKDIEINTKQNLDANEEIEVIVAVPSEVDKMIVDGKIIEGLMIADWYLARQKYPELFI